MLPSFKNFVFEAKKTEMQKLLDNKIEFTEEEVALIKKREAVWGNGDLAVFKSVDENGKTIFITHTHRAAQSAPTLRGAIGKFHRFVKSTS